MSAPHVSPAERVATARETAALRALFAASFGGIISYNIPERPDVPVLYVTAPEPLGSVYIKLDPRHLEVFETFPRFEDLIAGGREFSRATHDFREVLARVPRLTQCRPIYGEP